MTDFFRRGIGDADKMSASLSLLRLFSVLRGRKGFQTPSPYCANIHKSSCVAVWLAKKPPRHEAQAVFNDVL
jgi:hypothetical protein